MNELFDEIRDWIAESLWGKVIGIILLLYSINSFIWSFIEPITVKEEINYNYPLFHYLTVLIIAAIIMFLIMKKKVIKTINFTSLKTNNKETWSTVQGNHERKIDQEPTLGNYISFTGQFNDASEFKLDGVSSTGNTLRFTYNPKEQFTFYVHLKISSKNGDINDDGWFSLPFNIRKPYMVSAKEWAYPVKFKVIENTWLQSKVNLKIAVKKTFGPNWRFDQIKGIKIRGTGFLHQISIISG